MENNSKDTEEVKGGSLLISMPFMGDPSFDRTVILICEHNEDGSFGLILNQKSDFELQDFELFENDRFDDLVYIGGPVQHNTIHFLHGDSSLKNGLEVVDNVFWGGNFEDLKNKVENKEIEIDNIRFYLGYSGWETEQIKEELQRKSWIVNNNYSTNLFKTDSDKLWKTVLQEMGGKYAEMAKFPIDPSLN